ncbi:hypothetical protein HMI49_00680 [Corallococcus exercitus]|uniref:REase AHJR-like domain-containing protein n=1 Tax=Corallococcus exercitus TaxID=2316736 RepID=A0A7Y4NPJ0_9BACT|nr:hypothetical protein [Corallococcus exercitus]
MNDKKSTAHNQKVLALAADFKSKGYVVHVEPQPLELPFELLGYRPDLVAIKGDEGVVVEVKASTERLSIDRFREIAERIAEHKGWRFVLVTLDEPTGVGSPAVLSQTPDWAGLQQRMKVVDDLVRQGLWEPAVLYLWSVIEAALRRRAEQVHIPVERFPATRLLDQLYSAGEISVKDFDGFRTVLHVKNQVAHGVMVIIEPGLLVRVTELTWGLLAKWTATESG